MSFRNTCAALLRCIAALVCLGGGALRAQSAWVIADFDGDHRLDLVKLNLASADGPHIQLGLFDAGLTASAGFHTQRLRARDLDGDADQDLVLESESSVAIAVWINDGYGNFERAPLENYCLQFAHEDSRELNASLALPAPDLTDERSRGDAITGPTFIGFHPARVRMHSAAQKHPSARFRFVSRGRAPPFHS